MAYGGLSSATVARQLTAAVTAALTGFCCGCWMGWPSSSIPKLNSKSSGIVMSGEEVSWMVAVLDIGNLVSPLPSGYFMNTFGRKKTLISSGLLYLLSWILTWIAYNSWYLYVARFIAGLSRGTTYTVLPVYLAEISSVPIRGALTVLMLSTEWTGIIFASTVGPALSFKGIAGLSALFPIMFLVIFPLMPESPYYLLVKGCQGSALRAFHWLRGISVTTESEFEGVKECVDEDIKSRGRFVDLVLSVGNRRALNITVMTVILHRCMGGSSLIAYSSTTLPSNQTSFGPSEAVVLYSCASLLGSLVVSSLVDLCGRRPIVLVSSVGCSIEHGISAIFYYLYSETKVNMTSLWWIPYVTLVLNGLTRAGAACIVETFQAELFPTNLRGHVTATCTILIAVISFLIDKLYITVSISVGVYANFLFYCVSSILCSVFVSVFVFETKGKSFIEIQKMLCKKRLD